MPKYEEAISFYSVQNYKGCMECHIQGDFLLIWFDPNTDIIELVRLGSHSELFR